jgi:hypothetical protein
MSELDAMNARMCVGIFRQRNRLLRAWTVTVLTIALSFVGGFISGSCSTHREANDQEAPGEITSSVRMPDGSWWMTANLDVNTSSPPS